MGDTLLDGVFTGISDSVYESFVQPGQKNSIESASQGKTINTYGKVRDDISDSYKLRFLSPLYEEKGAMRYDLVVAYINEPLREKVSSKWDNLMTESVNWIDKILAVGLEATTKTFLAYRQLWTGNDPFSGKFLLSFDAEDDAYNDVYLPVRILQKMSSPGVRDYDASKYKLGTIRTLTPPIPSASNPLNGVKISVGKMVQYIGAIITSVEPTWSEVMADSGYPIHAEVEVDFQLVSPLTKRDFSTVSK